MGEDTRDVQALAQEHRADYRGDLYQISSVGGGLGGEAGGRGGGERDFD